MRLHSPERSRFKAFDLTPMIDVVLQLIIFFMFTSQFGELTRTEVELPRERGEEQRELDKPTMVVDISAAGDYFVDSRMVSLDEIVAMARGEIDRAGSPDAVVVQVRADRAATAGYLNRLTHRLADAGVRRWRMGTIDPAIAGDG